MRSGFGWGSGWRIGVGHAVKVAAAPVIPVNTGLPVITGDAHVGAPLVCSPGTWTGNPTAFAFQFASDGLDVGTDQDTYVPVDDDVGKAITCTVSATNVAGSANATSVATEGVTGGTIVNHPIEFGGLSLPSADGAKALDEFGAEVDFVSVDSVVSGDGTGWTVSSGRLICTTGTPAASDGAVLRCTTALGQIDVTIVSSGVNGEGVNLANAYGVASDTELAVVKALGAGTYSGKTILLRGASASYGTARINWTSQAPAAEVEIRSHVAYGATVPGFNLTGSSKIKLTKLTMPRLWEFADGGTGSVVLVNTTTGCSVVDNVISSNPLATSIMQGGTGYIMECLNAVGTNGSLSATDLTVTDNVIHDVFLGIRITGTGIAFDRNAITDFFQSPYEFYNATSDYTIKDNVAIGAWARGGGKGQIGPNNPVGDPNLWPYDRGDPHSGLGGWTPINHVSSNGLMEGNILMVGTNRFRAKGDYRGFATGPKLNDPGTSNPAFSNLVIRNNIIAANGNIGFEISYEQGVDFDANTIVIDTDTFETGLGPAPALNYNHDAGGNRARYNVACDFTLATLGTGLLLIGNEKVTSAQYSTELTGPATGWTPDNVIARLTPKAGSRIVASVPERGAITSYYNWSTHTGDWPWLETGFDISGQFTDVTDAVVDTLQTSNEVTLTGLSATGALVTVSSGTTFRVRDGSNNLVRDYDSAGYVVPDGYKITLQRRSFISPSTTVTSTVAVGATSDTWSIATVAGSVGTVALEYMATVDSAPTASSHSLSGFGIDGGDAGKGAVAVVHTNSLTSGYVPSAVSIGGIPAVKIAGTNTDTNIDGSCSIWKCVLGGSPTDNVSTSYPASVNGVSIAVYLLTGAALAAEADTFEAKSSAAQSTTLASSVAGIDTPLGGVLILGDFTLNGAAGGDFTGVAAIIEDHDAVFDAGPRSISAHRADGIARAAEVITYTGVNSWHHIVGASFYPSVGSPTPQPFTIFSNGITWTISDTVMFGQFVTGDYWVLPCTVSTVSPAWGDIANTHGSMVNPDPSRNDQGYDNRTGMIFAYNAAKRSTFPLVLAAGDSLISTVGKVTPTTGGGATHISQAAVLTCVASDPGPNAFRPQYVAGTKTIHTTDDVDYDLLPNLAVPSGCTVPDMSVSGGYLNRLWLDHGNLLVYHSQIFPEAHSPATGGYPYSRAIQLGQMALLALTNNAQKISVANRLIQYGIDQRGCMAVNGDTWSGNGGFGWGRKWPILFAEMMLGQSWSVPLYSVGSSGVLKFQEDAYSYFGNPGGTTPRWGEDCDITTGSYAGGNHTCRPSAGDVDQYAMHALGGIEGATAGSYEIVTHSAGIGPTLAARLLGHSWLTDWPAFFAYVDRYVNTEAAEIDAATSDVSFDVHSSPAKIDYYMYGGNFNLFMMKMWQNYR